MKDRNKIHHCAHCGGVDYRIDRHENGKCWTVCLNVECLHFGPTKDNEEDALDSWENPSYALSQLRERIVK